jgi:NTP pyrophosphatase (non-canonical NTP hydrolase)
MPTRRFRAQWEAIMDWSDYVAFTATTALPCAIDPKYLILGVLEEANECLEAMHARDAATHGHYKRVLRGDPEDALKRKLQQVSAATDRLTEELGDLSWYVARLVGEKASTYMEFYSVEHALAVLRAGGDPAAAIWLWRRLLRKSDIPLEDILDRNVAKLKARYAGSIMVSGPVYSVAVDTEPSMFRVVFLGGQYAAEMNNGLRIDAASLEARILNGSQAGRDVSGDRIMLAAVQEATRKAAGKKEKE